MFERTIDRIYDFFLSSHREKQVRYVLFTVATLVFIIHFSLAALIYTDLISLPDYLLSGNRPHPLTTIYTPFTIILLYEIYLLIYYMSSSIVRYLSMQYQVVALILVRGIFDRLANLNTSSLDFQDPSFLALLLACGGLLILMLLIFTFDLIVKKKDNPYEFVDHAFYTKYIAVKKLLALGLLFLLLTLMCQSLLHLLGMDSFTFVDVVSSIKRLNYTFFSTFFTALILVEVLLLLCMYQISDRFDKVIRNSGFVISTILLKLSFRAEGVGFVVLVLIAVFFGICILGVYQLFQKIYEK